MRIINKRLSFILYFLSFLILCIVQSYIFYVLDAKKSLFLQVVELQPKQVLTNEMISNSRRVGVSLASNKNLYDLCAHYQTDVDPRVKTVSLYDFKFFNSQTLIALDNPFMKLSKLSEDVGSMSHPLVLTYVDRSIKGLIYMLVVVLVVALFIFSDNGVIACNI